MSKLRYLLIIGLLLSLPLSTYADLEHLLDREGFNFDKLPQYKRALALDIARHLNDPTWAQFLERKLSSRSPSLALVPLLDEMKSFSRDKEFWLGCVGQLDKNIREAKGIVDKLSSILEIRLAFPEKGLPANKDFLVAYIPAGNEKNWQFIEAFDTAGNVHRLDVYNPPDKQIVIVGLDAKNDFRAGLALMNEELQKAGLQAKAQPTRGGIDVAKLNYIRLEDDKEPWISGDAEIYALVNGIAPESAKASIIAMEMPYLVNDRTDYYPNQVLVVWQNYRYKAANINLYEHDDSTNYKEIVATLVQKIGAVVPEYQMIADIASQIIRLMPDSWFTNDDDYVDVYYTLENKTYTNYVGVSKNARITLVPYFIPE